MRHTLFLNRFENKQLMRFYDVYCVFYLSKSCAICSAVWIILVFILWFRFLSSRSTFHSRRTFGILGRSLRLPWITLIDRWTCAWCEMRFGQIAFNCCVLLFTVFFLEKHCLRQSAAAVASKPPPSERKIVIVCISPSKLRFVRSKPPINSWDVFFILPVAFSIFVCGNP